MTQKDFIKSHDAFAAGYDAQVKEYHSYGHAVLFGMCFEYVKAGETLLDLGIGTGLSSVYFAEVGLEVTGLDGSGAMLDECRRKGFAKDLRQYNIQEVPLPFEDKSFSHVICCGVLHFWGNLLPVMADAVRVLKPCGIFGLTVASLTSEVAGTGNDPIPDYKDVPTAWGVTIFKHSDRYIAQLADRLGLTIEKEQKVLSDSGDKNAPDILFKVIVMRKEKV